jgi:hypothetical protein
MEAKDRKILHLRFGLTLLKILNERKDTAKANKLEGIRDHKLVSSLRKLSAASGIDFGTVQKISKGYQGLEFFTFIDLIEALDLNIVTFGEYFNAITDEEITSYQATVQKLKKVGKKKK